MYKHRATYWSRDNVYWPGNCDVQQHAMYTVHTVYIASVRGIASLSYWLEVVSTQDRISEIGSLILLCTGYVITVPHCGVMDSSK